MRNYELVCILDPQVGEQEFDQVIEKYKDYLEKNGAEIAHLERWGMRKLAYTSVSMKRRQQGYYVLYQFRAEPEVIDPLEQELKLEEAVLRYLVVVAGREFIHVPTLPSDTELFDQGPRRHDGRPSYGGDRDRGRDRDRDRPARAESSDRPDAGDEAAEATEERGEEAVGERGEEATEV